MINNTLFILLVILALGEIALIVCFVNLMGKVKDAASANQYFSAIAKLLELNREQNEDLKKRYDRLRETSDFTNEQYKIICDGFEVMVHQLKTISDQHSKILEAWKNVEERYSSCYDQYKYTQDCLKKVINLLEPTKFDEIAEGLEDLKELKKLLPPEIQFTFDPTGFLDPPGECEPLTPEEEWIQDGVEGETPPDPDAMKEFYETNGFEEIRKKALEEDS